MAVKIVFLDIDGVLNGHEWCHTDEGLRILPDQAKYLGIITRRTGAQVVLISSWRHWINDGLMTPRGFSKLLLTHGCDVDVIGALSAKDPALSHAEDRTIKILDWIEQHKPDKFVVLDDLPLKVPNLIRPDPGRGLRPHDISRAVEVLNG